MAEPSVFKKLCRELSNRVTPALRAAGFAPPPRDFGRDEIRYDFRRETPNGWHVVSILFDKHRHPHFSVMLCIEPKSGIEHLVAAGGTLIVGYLSARYRPWPFDLAPFRADRPYWQRVLGLRESRETQAVGAFLDLFPEIEAWWKTQVSSTRIHAAPVVYRGAQRHRH